MFQDRKIVLRSKDCHALWVSPKVLEEVEFPEKEIEGGTIVRDADGKPTGLWLRSFPIVSCSFSQTSPGVFLDNAQDILKLPEPTDDVLLARFKTAVKYAHAFGLTSIHDAGLDQASVAFFKRSVRGSARPTYTYASKL